MRYWSGSMSTPLSAATSISTPRATSGGNFSMPVRFQPRSPRCSSARKPFQILPWMPKWLSASMCVPVWLYMEKAVPV